LLVFPAEITFPVLAPIDLSVLAVRRLMSATDDVGMRYTWKTRRITRLRDEVFAQTLGRPVRVEVTPREPISALASSPALPRHRAGAAARQ
jgi:hypothetical protein